MLFTLDVTHRGVFVVCFINIVKVRRSRSLSGDVEVKPRLQSLRIKPLIKPDSLVHQGMSGQGSEQEVPSSHLKTNALEQGN